MDVMVNQAMDMLKTFDNKQLNFALNILRQIPQRRINENSYVCEYGYVHGDFNDETKAAFEESEEIIRQIESGERVPKFSNVSELMADLMSEEENEVWDRANNKIQAAV